MLQDQGREGLFTNLIPQNGNNHLAEWHIDHLTTLSQLDPVQFELLSRIHRSGCNRHSIMERRLVFSQCLEEHGIPVILTVEDDRDSQVLFILQLRVAFATTHTDVVSRLKGHPLLAVVIIACNMRMMKDLVVLLTTINHSNVTKGANLCLLLLQRIRPCITRSFRLRMTILV